MRTTDSRATPRGARHRKPFVGSSSRIFNFRRQWPKIRELLHEPDLRVVLDDSLAAYADSLRANYRRKHASKGEKTSHLFPFKPGDCPLKLARGDYWGCTKRFPRGDTLGWYQVWGACHALAPWVMHIGQRLYPSLHWSIRRSDRHSTVLGCHPFGEIRWVMDILFSESYSARQLLRWTRPENPVMPQREIRRLPKQSPT